jgi:hypothetical protein
MREEVLTIIEKHLPKEAGTLLQKRLAQADDDAQVLKQREADVKVLARERDELTKRVRLLEKGEAETAALRVEAKEKLADVEKRERNLAVVLAQHETGAALALANQAKEIVAQVFGSNRFSYDVAVEGKRSRFESNRKCSQCNSYMNDGETMDETTVESRTISGDK